MANKKHTKRFLKIIPDYIKSALHSHQIGHFDEAQRLYAMVLKIEPKNFDALHLMGVAYYQTGNFQKAIDYIDQAIAVNPAFDVAFNNRGNALRELSRFDEALASFDSSIKINPKSADAYNNRGNIFQKMGRFDEALASYDMAIINKFDFVEAFNNRGNLLIEMNRIIEALISFENSIKIKPYYVNAYKNKGYALELINKLDEAFDSYSVALHINYNDATTHYSCGNVLRKLNRLDEAVESYYKSIKINPNNFDAYNNLGGVLQTLKRFNEALDCYDNSIRIKPDRPEFHNNRGNALQDLKRFSESLDSYDRSILLNPEYAEAYFNHGNALEAIKDFNRALESYDKAIKLKPDYAKAYNNIGNIFQKCDKYDLALSFYDIALSLESDFAESYNNKGNSLQRLRRYSEALVNYDLAIQARPDYAIAHNNRGVALNRIGRHTESLESTLRAIEIDSSLASSLQTCANQLAYMSDYRDVLQYSDAAIHAANEENIAKIWESRLYTFIYHPDLSSVEICEEHKKWGMQYSHLGYEDFAGHDRTPKRRLRIGYVSPDFWGHTCRFYFEPLFSNHDAKIVEIFAYSNVLIEDEHTTRFKSYFNVWRNILGVPDQEVAQMIKNDRIDILVDACGHMQDTRLMVFAYKPAPIQVTWLGSAWTTGLPQIDYVLFDPYMAPEGTAASEKIVRLPRTWATFRPDARAMQSQVKQLPAKHSRFITFGYTGRTERLNHRVFDVWGKILMGIPNSKLILDFKSFANLNNQDYYRKIFSQHGIDTARVVMRSSENIFEGLGDIDILLDSFPHGGGTMVFDAAWMGVPVMTLATSRPVGRIATSLMTNLNLSDWVAQSEYEYVEKVINFSQDIPKLECLRNTMRERMKNSSVMDERSFTRDVENSFQYMWRIWSES
jgi:protein O-GlcNAc transferase